MIELIQQLEAWHWFTLGVVLLVAEIFGAGGYLLGLAIAAFFSAATLVLAPKLGWQWQLMLYAVFSAVATLVYFKRFRRFNEQTDKPNLNQPLVRQVGKVGKVIEVQGKQGKLQLGDAIWAYKTEDSGIKVGDHVEITDTDSMTLVIIKAETSEH